MNQTTLSEDPFVNSNLFTSHYLKTRVRDRDEWDCDSDARDAKEALEDLYELEGNLVEGYGEDALIDDWIDEVLDILGFGTQVEVTLPSGNGYVDELLFEDESQRRNAASVALDTDDTTDVFERGIGLVEAKQWDADFTERFSEQRPYRNASHQVKHYLENTPENIQWGVLTNGRKWRLYGTKDYETQTYYEVDLPELIEHGDLDEFKYFFVFFRPTAFRQTAGTTFLDEVWAESEIASQELGEDLQDNVFTALRVLGRGFIDTNDLDIDSEDGEQRDELKDQSLVLLYRLMFILYAEARNLIHPDNPGAEDEYESNFSLDSLRLDIHDTIGEVDEGFEDEYSEFATTMWRRLQDLFRLIDEGEDSLGIPPYNGGLFDQNEHRFLAENEVSNRFLAEVIYRLSTTQNEEGRYVLADYGDLDTRHLGSVYEGLLEHQFQIAPEEYAAVAEEGSQIWKPSIEVSDVDAIEIVPEGGLYVVNDEGERKTTGSYYTPDYVVTYIVEETAGPLVDAIRQDLIDQGFEPGTQEYLGPFLRRMTELKILDPAMGSGHFLTKATGYLAENVMSEVREVEVELGHYWDEHHVRREIAKECIYGVDVNGVAVELSKLSMWLETLSADRPLAFLDHHLKTGNSLLGSDITEVLSNGEGMEGQLTWRQVAARVRQQTLEHVMEQMQDLLEIDNESLEDIQSMKEIYADIRSDPLYQRLFELTNVYTAEHFGIEPGENASEDMAGAIENDDDWAALREEEWFHLAQVKAKKEKFFHWELEFPEVFFNEDGEKDDDAGFDAVIGNPPWLNAWRMTEKMSEQRKAIKNRFASMELLEGHWDLYIPFVIQSLNLCRDGGYHSFILPNTFLTEKYAKEPRRDILETHSFESILDFGERNVFPDVERQCIVFVAEAHPVDQRSHVLRECTEIDPFLFEDLRVVDASIWLEAYNYQIRVDKDYVDHYVPVINKIDESSDLLGQYLYVNVGATVSSSTSGEFSKNDVVHEEPVGNAKRFFQGTNVGRWEIDWDGEWLDYRADEMSGARHAEMFETEKVVVRVRTDEGGQLAAAYDSDDMYCDHTVLVCCEYDVLEDTGATTEFEGFDRKEDDIDLLYILALVNSKLMTWLFKNKFETGGLQGSYSDVWPQSVRSFPIPTEAESRIVAHELVENVEDIFTDEPDIDEDGPTPIDLLRYLAGEIIQVQNERQNLNLNILDYLGEYSDGPALSDLSPIPPEGRANSVLVKTDDETSEFERIRATEAVVERAENSLIVKLVPYVKPREDYQEDYDTNSHGYAALDPEPAMVFNNPDDQIADLIEDFVPYAVSEAGGFAGFRDDAITTKSLVDRLEELTLPDPHDVEDRLARYGEVKERAQKIEAEVTKAEEIIDQVVYNLFELTEEEIRVVEGDFEGENESV